MQAKNVLYAAVGAPVVAARKVTDQVNTIKGRVSKETSGYTDMANKTIDEWANEGEKVVSRISEGKVVEEISSKVDLDQAKEQVGKLRDQLEDMLATWRQSFRPVNVDITAEVKTAPAGKPAAKKPAAKTAAAKSTTAKSTTAKKTAAKKPAAKKPAAKTSAAKTTSAKSGSSATAKKSTAKSTPKAKTNS